MSDAMPQVVLVPLTEIKFDDSERHRKELNGIDDLISSIKKHGLLHPIILDDSGNLLAGRRRLEAFIQMGQGSIPARYFGTLSTTDQKLVELDENLRRQDISWQERVLAVEQLHVLLGSETATETAEYIGLSVAHVAKYLQVAEEVLKADPKVLACKSASQAIAIVDNRRKIALDTELSKLHSSIPPLRSNSVEENIATAEAPMEPSAQYEIKEGDFLKWAPFYQGEKFNFIHCDFPYGINFQDSASAGSERDDSQYEDSPELFWELTNCLVENLDRISLDSTHLLFWFHMKYYDELLTLFKANNLFVVELPIIWHKSDGAGIASDFRRRPKHVYETALFASRGDRFINNVVNDVYSCPTAKNVEGHLSAKPIAMLKHFFNMAVGPLTDFLDPTCGSGTSIRAAAALNANRALGLEINVLAVTPAQEKLETQLRLERVSNKVKVEF
jgi:ParB/RepB/Spo0J family partition protein